MKREVAQEYTEKERKSKEYRKGVEKGYAEAKEEFSENMRIALIIAAVGSVLTVASLGDVLQTLLNCGGS